MAWMFLSAACYCFGQAEIKTPPQPNKKPGIAVRSEVVRVHAIVTNRSGAPVTDLTQDDFTVLENGKLQKIAFFHHIQGNTDAAAQSPSEGDILTTPEQRAADRSTIVVFDQLNSTISEQVNARAELLKLFSASTKFVGPVCLIAFDFDGVGLVQNFTTNPPQLAEALKNLKGHHSPKDVPQTNPVENSFRQVQGWNSKSATRNAAAARGMRKVLDASLADRELSLAERSAFTLEALREIGESVSGVPGPKSLIWATGGGFPFQIDDAKHFATYQQDLLPLYENAWRTLNRANIVVYPLDVEDLVNPAYVDASVGHPLPEHFDSHANVSNLEAFAEATGGRLCNRETTAVACFAKAENDSSDYYLIGFYEYSGDPKPGWRSLAVKVDRPDMHVHARSGYFARGPHDDGMDRKEDIELALASFLESNAVPFTVRLTTVTGAQTKTKVGFIFIIPPGAATIDESDNNHLSLDFAALARNVDGTPAGTFSQSAEGKLRLEDLASMRSQGAAYPGIIDLPPGEYSIRFVVRDNISGRTGSTSASLRVP
jgi:VWFA-related protein